MGLLVGSRDPADVLTVNFPEDALRVDEFDAELKVGFRYGPDLCFLSVCFTYASH